MFKEGRCLRRLFIPIAEEVVGHDSDPVQVFVDDLYVVGRVDDLLGGRHGSGENPTPRLKLSAQLLNPFSEA